MRRLAIIPARGGSKRLPRKNVLDFFGKPMLAYTVAAACDSGCFARVLVSTEDEAIAAAARDHGAEVDRRPQHLAGDDARVLDVCLELLDREAAAGRIYDVLGCLYATAPLRNADDIRATVALVEPGRCDFAMAVTDFAQPVHQALRLGADGALQPVFPDLIDRRRDTVDRVVAGNGSTYVVAVEALRRHRTFYGPGLRGHVMPASRSVDIDVAEDLALALYHAGRIGL